MAESGLHSTSIRGGPARQPRSSRPDGRCVSRRNEPARCGSIQNSAAQTMTNRIGVDIGGTFTDFALFDESGSEIAVLVSRGIPCPR